MADWKAPAGLRELYRWGEDESTSQITKISGSSGWIEVVAATSEEISFIHVGFIPDGTGFFARLGQLAIGAAGFEVPIVTLRQQSKAANSSEHNNFFISEAIRIPAGSRVSVQMDNAYEASIHLYAGGSTAPAAYSSLESINTTSVTVDADAAGNTKGAWAEVTASMPFTAFGGILTINPADGTDATQDTLVDIGIGSAGSEVVIVSNHFARGNAAERARGLVRFYDVIPEGTRVAVRQQSSIVNANDDAGVYLHGFR